MSRIQLLSAALVAGSLGSLLTADARAQNLTTELVANGFSQPLYVTAPPGDTGRLFVVQQRGLIRIVDLNTNGIVGTFLNLSTVVSQSGNERGLLGLAFHPDYLNNGRFFVSYTDSGGNSRLVEYSAMPPTSNTANSVPVQTIYSIGQPFSNHNGGCIQFGPDGYLYLGLGDGGSAGDPGNRAQNLSNSLGKMLRFDVDAAAPFIPASNPFVGVAGNDEIWAYGLRNPWRFSFDRATGDMYIGDVGQNAWEEIDFQPASSTGGENYGWRCYEGNAPFSTGGCPPIASTVQPIQVYSHGFGCSVTGGVVYRGPALPALQGTYFYADYCTARIWSLRYVGGMVTEFTDRTAELNPAGPLAINSITSFGEDASGEMYIVDQGGEIFRLTGSCTPSKQNYCGTSPNATGSGALIFSSGSLELSNNDFLLAVGGGNPGQFGIFFYGLESGQQPGGNGIICINPSSGLYRLYPVVALDFIGGGFYNVDFTAPPMNAGPGQVIAGTSYYFQFWYRDPGGPGGSDYNFSDAIQATFCD